MSPSRKLIHAKKLIATTSGFKLDANFKGPISGRSLGGKIYNGPGKNHDELGKIEKDGAVQILARTEDRVWLSVKCGETIEGWVLASEVDLTFNRKVYKQHDETQIALDSAKGDAQQTLYAIRETILRSKPKWAAHTIA